MGGFSRPIRDVRGQAVAPIVFELDGDLAHWRVEIPDQVRAGAEAFTGPTADPAKRVQTLNPPGSEVGPSGKVATWGRSTEAFWEAFGFRQNFVSGRWGLSVCQFLCHLRVAARVALRWPIKGQTRD
jgi:hypothetical protein